MNTQSTTSRSLKLVGFAVGGALLIAGGVAAALSPLWSERPRAAAASTLTSNDAEPSPTFGSPASTELESSPETPPWAATTAPAAALPPGHVPASEVKPPLPESHPVPAPVPPPNPQLTTPPLDNPGGVNGDRPERVP